MKNYAFKSLVLTLAASCVLLHSCASSAAPVAVADADAKVNFTLDKNGLKQLSVNGQSLLALDWHGAPVPDRGTPLFTRKDGTTYTDNSKPISSTLDAAKNQVTRDWSWGTITATYAAQNNELRVRCRVENKTADTLALNLRVAKLTFPAVPTGLALDAGAFGNGGSTGTSGKLHPLAMYPLVPRPQMTAPVILIDWGSGALTWSNADVKAPHGVAVPFASNAEKTEYPLWLTPEPLAPGATGEYDAILRFGPAGSSVSSLAPDVLEQYRQAYPMVVQWQDRRPIAALHMASFPAKGKAHPANNPRGWFGDDKTIDTSTDAGRAEFRRRALEYADQSIAVMREMNAQGMVLWAPEGREFREAGYAGDPRLIAQLAPEMEWKPAPAEKTTVDAYFQKFRDAGFAVGVTLRPQQLKMENGVPVQENLPDATQTLLDKIAYAQKRWGATLFYVDSTLDKNGSLDPDVFRRVQLAHPDVLVMPENEAPRYFAYSAPLNSFFHHGVTSTPAVAREIYPNAFSVLLAQGKEQEQNRDALVAAVANGDILIFDGWYNSPANAAIKSIYQDAAKMP